MITARKAFILFLTVLLCLSLAACSEKQAAPTITPPATTLPEEVTLEHIVVGALFPGAYNKPNTYSYDHHQDLIAAMSKSSVDHETAFYAVENVRPLRDDVWEAVEYLVKCGANLIFCTEFGYSPYVLEIADTYPNIIFCQLGGTERNGQNLIDYFGEIYKSYYIAGCEAGQCSLYAESNAIGFVSAYGKENPDAVAAINAFALGVRVFNPDATIYLRILDNPLSGIQENAAALDLILHYDCSVLAQYTNTEITLTTAQHLNVRACGPYFTFDTDNLAPEAQIVSPQFKWTHFYSEAIQAAQDITHAYDFGQQLGTDRFYPHGVGIANTDTASIDKKNEKELTSLESLLISYLQRSVPTDSNDLTSGQDDPRANSGIFSGKRHVRADQSNHSLTLYIEEVDLLDNQGNVIVPAGEKSLTTDQIRSMDFYVEGIVELTFAP